MAKMRMFVVVAAMMCVIAVSACGRKEAPQQKVQKEPPPETARTKNLAAADRDTLLSVLPDVAGWTREEPEYDQNTAGSTEIAVLESAYTMGEETVIVKIEDTASASSLRAPVVLALQMNVSRQDRNGYDRVCPLAGLNVIETFHEETRESEITFIVKDRYVVMLNTESEGGMNLLSEFVGKMDFSKLK